MKIKKILFATDFSDHSKAAFQHATALAAQYDALLLIAHVDESLRRIADTGYAGWPVYQDDLLVERALDETVPSDPTVKYQRRMLSGTPAHEITRLAKDEDVDLIVIGTHGRTGLTRVVLGSVAEKVVRKAHCPVLTIRQPTTAREDAPAEVVPGPAG